ncbi:hypothetical protein LSH36_78g04000 [Paralvinella palmiformis]|uniref:Uncharacterized protein n=1 Tax=Paralvinella palmiformis TaxID=53620 RepID=A0AAD9K280_9ANNE|nr:hypothetical protein LSH36_78g04000 [Paralvinella palmiformis]
MLTPVLTVDEDIRQEQWKERRMLQQLLSRHTQQELPEEAALTRPLPEGPEPIHLLARNYDIEMTNYDLLLALEGEEKIYGSEDTGDACGQPNKLPNEFLGSKTRVECVNDNPDEESEVTVSPASQAAVRYLAGQDKSISAIPRDH